MVTVLAVTSTAARAHDGVDHSITGSQAHPVAEAVMHRGEVMRETNQERATEQRMNASNSGVGRAEVVDARCAKITANINARLTNYADNKELILGRYERIHERVTALLQKLDEKGYDTSAVRAHLATLRTLLTDAASDYRLFIEKLEATKQYACGNSDGQFLSALKASQEAMKVFQADLKELRTFVQASLRPSVKALIDQEPVAAERTNGSTPVVHETE